MFWVSQSIQKKRETDQSWIKGKIDQLDIGIFNLSKLASRETALEGLTPAYTGLAKKLITTEFIIKTRKGTSFYFTFHNYGVARDFGQPRRWPIVG